MTQRWLKLDERFPFTQTSVRLREKFGRDGPLVWVCMLTAAKRGTPEGTIMWVNDDHFWSLLGLNLSRPDFSPDAFLRLTGQLKQTRRTRSGDVEKTVLTHWHDWQEDWRREDARERMSRKRAVSGANTLRTESEPSANGNRTEKEIEKEREKESKPTPLPDKPATTQIARRDDLWDVLVDLFGEVVTKSERGRRNRAVGELRQIGATPVEVREHFAEYNRRWPGVELTAMALVSNWSQLDRPAPRSESGVTAADLLEASRRLT